MKYEGPNQYNALQEFVAETYSNFVVLRSRYKYSKMNSLPKTPSALVLFLTVRPCFRRED